MRKSKPIVTREWLRDKIAEQPERVIARALIAIYERQTSEEQLGGYTKFSNGRGFSGADAELGTKCAEAATRGELLPWMVKVWSGVTRTGFPKICKYARQLNEIAEINAQHSPRQFSKSMVPEILGKLPGYKVARIHSYVEQAARGSTMGIFSAN